MINRLWKHPLKISLQLLTNTLHPRTWAYNSQLIYQKSTGNIENIYECVFLNFFSFLMRVLEYLTLTEQIWFQYVQHRITHVAFWTMRISSKTGSWLCWESDEVSELNSTKVIRFLPYFWWKSVSRTALFGKEHFFFVSSWNSTTRGLWQTGILGTFSLHCRSKAITKIRSQRSTV